MKFEDYLQGIHASQYRGTDDDMPDDFEKWLNQFDANDILEMVKKYELFKKTEKNFYGDMNGDAEL